MITINMIGRMTIMDRIKQHDEHCIDTDKHADHLLLEQIYLRVKDRLGTQRKKGRHGWWDDKTISIASLKKDLVSCVDRLDTLDAFILMNMIYIREEE